MSKNTLMREAPGKTEKPPSLSLRAAGRIIRPAAARQKVSRCGKHPEKQKKSPSPSLRASAHTGVAIRSSFPASGGPSIRAPKNFPQNRKKLLTFPPNCAILFEQSQDARVVELADSLDSGSSAHSGRAGSTPASRTKENARNREISGIFLTFCPFFEAQTRPLEPSDNKNDNRICAFPDIALYRRCCGKPQVKTGVILPLRGANQLPRPYPFCSRCSGGCRCPAS